MNEKRSVVIVSPALAETNNGNWRTASRWRGMLAAAARVRIVRAWPDGAKAEVDEAMIALHAWRSAASISAWAARHPGRGLVVVLTGTDLYGEGALDAIVARSMKLAQRLVVLQDLGREAVPARLRDKVRVIYQSTTKRATLPKTRSHLRAVMVGHLRAVKSPETLFEAARLLRGEPDIFIDHVGAALDPGMRERARKTASKCPNYRWLGELSHEVTRRRIQRAHVLVHASLSEGGAHVIMEAARCATPVLASAIPGNVGMLGDGYGGYFPAGEAQALANLLVRCRDDASFMRGLRGQCRSRSALFSPESEEKALRALLRELRT